MLILNESIRDGETAKITCDRRGNRLVIHPNHQPVAVPDADMEESSDEEPMEVERLD